MKGQGQTAQEILGLYRALLRAAKLLPTPERRNLVLSRIRQDFRKNRSLPSSSLAGSAANGSSQLEENEDTAGFAVAYGHVQLDNLRAQVNHLNALKQQEDQLIIPVDIHQPDRNRWGRWNGTGKAWGKWNKSAKSLPPAAASPSRDHDKM
ncbi:hypothetical protein BC832DRAFT_536658 [Gaertneriomyces semiglobifer]|nr:hypothetical protein BC832DRAFT_536658 [Gaertneriomyces semiglobifer]